MDLSSVAPNSTPARFVNSQLVCLLPVGVFNEFLFIYDICFLIYSVPNQHSSAKMHWLLNKVIIIIIIYYQMI